jgi:arylsulfatase A
MKRTLKPLLILICSVIVFSCGKKLTGASADRPPKVIVIFTDDQGYADLSCYGARDFKTPHIDRMASEGIRFTNFYVGQPVCSASRAALLTTCRMFRCLFPTSSAGLKGSILKG